MLAVLLRDAHSEASEALFAAADGPIATSDFLSTEVFAVLATSVRSGRLTHQQAVVATRTYEQLLRLDATNHSLTAADGRLAIEYVKRVDLKLRAPDALHLAICQRVGATLLTFDDDQAAAAVALGIPLAA